MKKVVTISATILAGITLAACGHDSHSSSTSSSSETSYQTHSKYYFNGTTANVDNAKIKITGVHFYNAASSLGYDKQEVVFDYQITNKSDHEINANNGWLAAFKVYQDGKELSIGNLPTDTSQTILDNQTETIKRGETVKCRVAYELNNSKSVVVKAMNHGKSVGQKSFKPSDFKDQVETSSESTSSQTSSSDSTSQTAQSSANSSSTSSASSVVIAGHSFHHEDFYGTDILVGDNGEGEAGEWAVNSPEVYGDKSTQESVRNQLHDLYNNN